MSKPKWTYRIEGMGDRLGDGWSSDYAGPAAAGISSLRQAMQAVAALRRLLPRDEWAGPWRIVREQDRRVVRSWGAR